MMWITLAQIAAIPFLLLKMAFGDKVADAYAAWCIGCLVLVAVTVFGGFWVGCFGSSSANISEAFATVSWFKVFPIWSWGLEALPKGWGIGWYVAFIFTFLIDIPITYIEITIVAFKAGSLAWFISQFGLIFWALNIRKNLLFVSRGGGILESAYQYGVRMEAAEDSRTAELKKKLAEKKKAEAVAAKNAASGRPPKRSKEDIEYEKSMERTRFELHETFRIREDLHEKRKLNADLERQLGE